MGSRDYEQEQRLRAAQSIEDAALFLRWAATTLLTARRRRTHRAFEGIEAGSWETLVFKKIRNIGLSNRFVTQLLDDQDAHPLTDLGLDLLAHVQQTMGLRNRSVNPYPAQVASAFRQTPRFEHSGNIKPFIESDSFQHDRTP